MSVRRFGLILALVVLSALVPLGASAEVAQRGGVRVSFTGKIDPQRLPRHGSAPISLSFGGRIVSKGRPPKLRRINLELNKQGQLDSGGLPACHRDQIQPATNANALAACRESLIGSGQFTARVLIPGQAPFPSRGRVLAFHGTESTCSRSRLDAPGPTPAPTGWLWPGSSRTQGGRQGERTAARDPRAAGRGHRDAQCHSQPVIFAHVYGKKPVPTSYTLTFKVAGGRGTFGTSLSATLADVTSKAGYVTGLELTVSRRYRARGRTHSYLSAGCPLPDGIAIASFPLARASFAFASGPTISQVLNRSCRARG